MVAEPKLFISAQAPAPFLALYSHFKIYLHTTSVVTEELWLKSGRHEFLFIVAQLSI